MGLAHFIFILNATSVQSNPIDGDWIMSTGFWDDAGIWIDDEIWID